MKVGLLGIQGAFRDHISILKNMDADHIIVRDKEAIHLIDRLILPGGESTVMTKFLKKSGMINPLKERISDGMPVWGICAGAILLAETVDDGPGALSVLPATIIRNAYGRQRNSSVHTISIPILKQLDYRGIFIRAPKLTQCNPTITIQASMTADPVFIQYFNMISHHLPS